MVLAFEALVERVTQVALSLPTAHAGRASSAQRRAFTVGLAGKVFALVLQEDPQPGLHVRSNEPSVRSDPRVATSEVNDGRIEVSNNFVWLRDSSQWALAELTQVLAASLRLATRKDGGVKRGNEFRDLALVVRKALVETPAQLRPPGPHHAAGPAAKLVGQEGPFAAALASWVVDQFAPFVTDRARPLYEGHRQVLRRELSRAQLEALRSAAPEVMSQRPIIAAHFSLGAYDPISGPGLASRAVMQWHAQLLETSPLKLPTFLSALDDTVLNGEFRALAWARAKRAQGEVERVLWRGTDAKGNAGHWVARLTAQHYASLQKVGSRWAWVEGARDDVLACVPDATFAAASAIALARDLPGVHGLPIGFVLKAV